jgi:hypothetical protein
MSSVEGKAIKKAKAKDAKAKKAAAAVKTGGKGKAGQVRTGGRKTKISRDLDIDLGENEEEIDFPPNIWWLRSGQICSDPTDSISIRIRRGQSGSQE